MNDFDNLLANEIQQEEFNSLMTENSLFGNIMDIASVIGTSIGLDFLRNGIQNDDNQSLENEDNQLSADEDNQSLENEDNHLSANEDNQLSANEDNQSLEDDSNQSLENENNQSLENEDTLNPLNVDNSFIRFYQSMMEFAEEGQNAFDDNPESIPAQIYESIFNFTPEWRSLNRGANSYMRTNQRWADTIRPILPQSPTSYEALFSESSDRDRDRGLGNMMFNIINSGLSYAQRTELQNIFQNEMNSVPITLDAAVLNSFELKKYSEVEENDNGACTICLIEHNDDDEVRILRCKHFFHKECIDKWLNEHSYKCPICRCELGSSHPNVDVN